MRFDSAGMFWHDLPTSRKAADRALGPMPPIPETGWRPPSEFPNLSSAKVLGVDVETYDPELRTAGPGWARKKGHIVGISLAVPGRAWYFPIRHETQPEYNLDPVQTLRYVAAMVGNPRQPKVGTNLIYDAGWLEQEGAPIAGMMYDVQFAEALLNSETPDVSLENLAENYLGEGKVTSILYEWLASWLGGRVSDRQRANIYRSPVTLAGPYAEADAYLPIEILSKQWPLLAERGVLELFHLESRLIPLLVKMRKKGAPVDIPKAEEIYDRLGKGALSVEEELKYIAGQPVNPAASGSIKAAFDRLGLEAPMKMNKQKGEMRITFEAEALEEIEHPLAAKIIEHRQLLKVRNTFIKSYIIDKQVDGRIHCTFHPLKGEKGGARSGRFSSSSPNLQNIPVRTDLGGLVREAFASRFRWRKWDYSQIEYRLLAHHAVGPGSDEIRARFIADPDADYHELAIELVKEWTGMILDRRPAKTVNFGLVYGMSEKELARRLQLSAKAGKQLFEKYHIALPFVKKTMEAAVDEVNRYGNITTLLGRKSDFLLWGPEGYHPKAVGLPYDEARDAYGPDLKRAYTHKAVNRKLQGGAADIMKKAMVDAYEAGLFEEDACGIPILTVHDELDFEDEHDNPDRECWDELKNLMESCVQARVPIVVKQSIGKNWRDAD